jgi:hypothetical protein
MYNKIIVSQDMELKVQLFKMGNILIRFYREYKINSKLINLKKLFY